jgi:hypothetical protein
LGSIETTASARAGFLGGREGAAPRLARSGKRGFAEVEGADLVARLDQIGGHPAAHVAEADKGDFHKTPLMLTA